MAEGRSTPAPLLVLLHGGGRTGQWQLNIWKPLADKEKVILLAPTSFDGQWDSHPQEDLFNIRRGIKEAVANGADPTKTYLIGNSKGGKMALWLALQSDLTVAAVALHSPTPDPRRILNMPLVAQSRRKPIGVWIGDSDSDINNHWGLTLRDYFREQHQFDIDLTVIPEHRHEDYNTLTSLPQEIWNYFKNKTASDRR